MLSKTQLKQIEKIIRRRFRTFSYRTLGPRSLTDAEIADLKSAGILPSSTASYIGDAHTIGKIAAMLGPSTTSSLTYDQVLEMAKKMVKTTGVETKAIQYATDHAGQYIKGLEDDLVRDVTLRASKTATEVLRQEVAGAVKDRLTPGQLKTNLWAAIDNRARDWQRIASTELQNSIQQGIYNELIDSHEDGDEQLCYKSPRPSACKHCKRIYLHEDGTPKVFRLKDLETSNVGLKAAEWKPTIEATHPWCQCQLHRLEPGHGFKKIPVSAEEFEFEGHTYRRGARIDQAVVDRLPLELKRKTKLASVEAKTGETVEPVSKAEINLPYSEDDDCAYCEY